MKPPPHLRAVPPPDAGDAAASAAAEGEALDRLIRRCQEGDEQAWAELYRQELPRVARFMQRLLGPDREADDAVQQVFVELFTSLPRFRGEAQPATWIYSIASHVAQNRLRTEWRRRRRAAALLELILDVPGTAAGPGPDRTAVAREELRQLGAAVDALPVRHRMVWMLRDIEGLTTDEVAAALGLEPGTVRSRLHHARRKVMARLRLRPGDEEGGPR